MFEKRKRHYIFLINHYKWHLYYSKVFRISTFLCCFSLYMHFIYFSTSFISSFCFILLPPLVWSLDRWLYYQTERADKVCEEQIKSILREQFKKVYFLMFYLFVLFKWNECCIIISFLASSLKFVLNILFLAIRSNFD